MKRSSNRSVATRLRALLLTVGLVLAGAVGVTTATPAAAATGDILPPFSTGETWYICQGYDGPVSHTGTSEYGLDLTGGPNCDSSAAGRTVKAPIAGTVYYYQASYGNLCVNIAGGRSYTLTHITSSVTSGSVSAGQTVGTVGAAGSYNNNGVAHIHFQMWETANCYSGSGIPFDSAHNSQICGAPDLTTSGPSDGNGTWSGTAFTGQGCGGASSTRANIRNGGFNNGTSYWTRSGTANFTTYGTGTYEGSGYGATNAAAAGDGIRQDVAINLTVGRSFCVSAQVRTTGAGAGASGSMAVYLLGSTATESSSKTFSGLGTDWTPIETCVTASSVHSTLRVQFYPAAGGATLGVDAVEVRESLLDSAGFNGSTSGWGVTGSANFANYSTGAYEDSGYVAVNASVSGDGLKQDRTRSVSAGMTHCLEARVRSNTAGVTASGSMAVYLLGSTATESSSKTFTGVGGDWTPIKTCVTATGAHTSVRVQFYPAPGGATIGVDAVSFHATLAKNGGFNGDSSGWVRNGTANFALGTSGAYEGSGFGAVNAATGNDGVSATVTRAVAEGDMYCVSAHVRTNGSGTGASGTLTLWVLGTTANENSEYTFTNLTNDWTPIKTCVTATGAHTSLKVQLYPMPGGPTVAVDAVDMG